MRWRKASIWDKLLKAVSEAYDGREPPAFSPRAYKRRNLVERFFNKIKHYRAIATRFERHDANFLASVKLAALRIWMRFNESVT